MMDNGATCETLDQPCQLKGNHECEVRGRGLEAEESGYLWKNCKKNPGHQQFIPVREFMEKHLISSLSERDRVILRDVIDRTVKIRVQWTSKDRPDDDAFSKHRGTDVTRLATGYMAESYGPINDKPCHCLQCDGKVVRKHWKIEVQTAHHVVYNTEEAKRTSFDLFYDDESCRQDGTMKTVRAVDFYRPDPRRDNCRVRFVTHDEALVQKTHLTPLDELIIFHVEETAHPVLIVSHPHGQPKMITLGKVLNDGGYTMNCFRFQYDAATCPGSSGATVFISDFSTPVPDPDGQFIFKSSMSVHSGAFPPTSTFLSHVNYGYFYGYGSSFRNFRM